VVLGETLIIAGIGCRRGASADAVVAAIAAALSRAGLRGNALALIATPADKGGESGIASAASALSVPLVLVPQAQLEAAGSHTVTQSERVAALWNVPSVAEAAALAAGGDSARLIAPRVALGPVTCALAEAADPVDRATGAGLS
jgi:cobalt-precorrin 5A hydrolase